MGTWMRSSFTIWCERPWEDARGWYEVDGWMRDALAMDLRSDGWWTVTHLPTGLRLYDSIDRRSVLRFIRLIEGLTDWAAISPEGERDLALVLAVQGARDYAEAWEERPPHVE